LRPDAIIDFCLLKQIAWNSKHFNKMIDKKNGRKQS
jgi:hypothetical protein